MRALALLPILFALETLASGEEETDPNLRTRSLQFRRPDGEICNRWLQCANNFCNAIDPQTKLGVCSSFRQGNTLSRCLPHVAEHCNDDLFCQYGVCKKKEGECCSSDESCGSGNCQGTAGIGNAVSCALQGHIGQCQAPRQGQPCDAKHLPCYSDLVCSVGLCVDHITYQAQYTRPPTTSSPSEYPTATPSLLPSSSPSLHPSRAPSPQPSNVPSQEPSDLPSASPMAGPSAQPSNIPSEDPTMMSSEAPSSPPTYDPSSAPSLSLGGYPSATPSNPQPHDGYLGCGDSMKSDFNGQPFIFRTRVPLGIQVTVTVVVDGRAAGFRTAKDSERVSEASVFSSVDGMATIGDVERGEIVLVAFDKDSPSGERFEVSLLCVSSPTDSPTSMNDAVFETITQAVMRRGDGW